MDLLWWAVIALVISLVAGALGFTNVAAGAATIAKVLFGIFLVIALILFLLIALGIGAGVDAVTSIDALPATALHHGAVIQFPLS